MPLVLHGNITLMIYFGLVLLGLCFGSFVNAFVWRLHVQPKAKSLKLKAKDLSILHGRSMCVHCHHTLAWYDLLPVVSWISLGGKCRYCKKSISFQYPLVELATAFIFVLSYIRWPHGFETSGLIQFVFWLIAMTGFMALVVYDLRWMLLPNSIVFPLLVLIIFQVLLVSVVKSDLSVLTGAIGGLLSIGGLFFVLFQVSSGKWIGGGDVKLGFVLGLMAGGLLEGLLVIFIASLLGTVAALPVLGIKKDNLKKRIAFGPFLIAALVIVYLFGSSLINWYKQQILLV